MKKRRRRRIVKSKRKGRENEREREGGWKKGRIPGVLNETMGGTVQQIVTDSDGSARE